MTESKGCLVNRLAEMQERMRAAELERLYMQLGCPDPADCWVDGVQA